MGLRCLSACSCLDGRSLSAWLLPPRPWHRNGQHPERSHRPEAWTPRSSRQDRSFGAMTAPSPIRSQALRSPAGTAIQPSHRPRPMAPLMGFVPLRRISSREVRFTRGLRPRHLPAPGFLPLLRACSLPGRVGLFRPTNVHGVPTLQGLPPPSGVAGSSPTLSPPGVTARHENAPPGPLQGLAPARRSVPLVRRFRPDDGPIPSWAFSLPRVSSLRMGAASRPLPSRASQRSRSPAGQARPWRRIAPAPQGLPPQGGCVSPEGDPPTLPRFLACGYRSSPVGP